MKKPLIYFLAIVISNIFGLLVSITIARNLGPKVYGSFSIIINFVNLLIFITNLGINLAILYYVSSVKNKGEIIFTGYILRLFIGILAFSITILSSNFLSKTYRIPEILFIISGIYLFLIIMYNTSIATLNGLGFFHFSGYFILLFSIGKLITALLSKNMFILFQGFIFSLFIIVICELLIIKKYLKRKINKKFIYLMLNYGFFSYLALLFGSLITQVPILILGKIDKELTGIFSISLTLSLYPVGLTDYLWQVLIQKVASKTKYDIITKYTFLIASFLSFSVLYFGRDVIIILYGKNFSNIFIYYLSLIFYFHILIHYINSWLLGKGESKKVAIINAILCFTSLVGYFLLIPIFLAYGVIISLATSTLIVLLYIFLKINIDKKIIKLFGKTMIPSLISLLIIHNQPFIKNFYFKILLWSVLFYLFGKALSLINLKSEILKSDE